MDCRLHHWKRIAAALVAGGCVLLGASACERKSKPKQPLPNVDALREALQRTAAVAFPSPSLMNRRFTLVVPADQVAAKTADIAKIANEYRGTVLSNPGSGPGTSLLISLPGDRLKEFSTRALGQSLPPGEEPDLLVMLEVSIAPTDASPAPTASPARTSPARP